MQFPIYQHLQSELKKMQNELKEKTYFYFQGDVQATARRVQQGKSHVEELYGKLDKLRHDNLLKAYDKGYPDLFPDNIHNMTPEEAYACYHQYPEQYQSVRDFQAGRDQDDPSSPDDDFIERYDAILRKSNYLKTRTSLAKKIRNTFRHKLVFDERPYDDSASIYTLFEPAAFSHLSEPNVRAKLAHRLLGIVDYRVDVNIELPISDARKRKIKVNVIDGLSSHRPYAPADIDIIFLDNGKGA